MVIELVGEKSVVQFDVPDEVVEQADVIRYHGKHFVRDGDVWKQHDGALTDGCGILLVDDRLRITKARYLAPDNPEAIENHKRIDRIEAEQEWQQEQPPNNTTE